MNRRTASTTRMAARTSFAGAAAGAGAALAAVRARAVSVAARSRAVLCSLLIVATLVGPASAVELWSDETGERSHSLNATVKWTSLLSRAPTDTLFYPREWSGASLWRLRLALDSRPRPALHINIAYEQRARIESDATGAGGALALPSLLPAPYRVRQLDDDLIDADDGLSLRHELDRASANLAWGSADLTIGRQAVGWGRGLMFSVVDIFAPFSPLESDREWRRGIDAVRLRLPFSDLWSLDAVGAFGESMDESAFAARAHGYVGDIDGELLVVSRREVTFYAATASLPLFDAEIHGELGVFLEPDRVEPLQEDDARNFSSNRSAPTGPGWDDTYDGDVVLKALVGGSRTFDILDGLYVVAEYHYSGYGAEDVTDMDELTSSSFTKRYASGDTQILGRHAVAVQFSYGFAGVTPLSVTWISSPVDGSGVVIPSVSWS
ncbi:hypothetical protein K8S17_03325, partial [bacterium]|nr:hypothetical protein [bacterium]